MKMKGFFPFLKHSIYAPPTQLTEKKNFRKIPKNWLKFIGEYFILATHFCFLYIVLCIEGLKKTSWHGTWYAIRFFLDFGNLFSKCSFAVFVVVHFILLILFHPKIVVRCYSCPFTKNVFAFGRAARFHEEMHQLFQVRM